MKIKSITALKMFKFEMHDFARHTFGATTEDFYLLSSSPPIWEQLLIVGSSDMKRVGCVWLRHLGVWTHSTIWWLGMWMESARLPVSMRSPVCGLVMVSSFCFPLSLLCCVLLLCALPSSLSILPPLTADSHRCLMPSFTQHSSYFCLNFNLLPHLFPWLYLPLSQLLGRLLTGPSRCYSAHGQLSKSQTIGGFGKRGWELSGAPFEAREMKGKWHFKQPANSSLFHTVVAVCTTAL